MISIPKFDENTETELTLPKLLRTKDVLEFFNIHRSTLYSWRKENKLRSIKIGHSTFFKMTDIKNLIENNYL